MSNAPTPPARAFDGCWGLSERLAQPLTPADAQLVAHLRARAALAGFELVHLSDGTFVVSRWGMSRSLEHPMAVERFLQRAGVPAISGDVRGGSGG